MLYITRKLDQAIIVNDSIEIRIVEIKGKTVKLGIEFPASASVLRKEVYDRVVEQNKDAAAAALSPDASADFFAAFKEAQKTSDEKKKQIIIETKKKIKINKPKDK
jgi:carbon storage regulator